MQIEIEGSPRILFELLETNKVGDGDSVELPGGANIRYVSSSWIEKRSLGTSAAPVFRFILSQLDGIAIGIVSAWLYDKLKGTDVRAIRIERRTVELTRDGIQRAIEESLEITKK